MSGELPGVSSEAMQGDDEWRRFAGGQVRGHVHDPILPPTLAGAFQQVRHLRLALEGGEIRIGARCSSARLTVWVEHPVDPESTSKSGAGVGLANVRHRLENVFGDEARLRSGRSGEIYRAEVVIPVPRVGEISEQEGDSDD